MLLQIANGKKEFGEDVLFENVSFEIKGNEKIAIIGRNGCGKSTLLKIISSQMTLDDGTLTISPKVTVGYLAQQAFSDESLTVQQEFDRVHKKVLDLKDKMEQLAKKLETEYSDELFQQYSQIQTEFEGMNGYNYNQEQLTLFTKFGFSLNDLSRPLSTFSGGQKTRIAFVKLLMSKPDILLLDEPTNHLDMQTIEWLEGYLKKYSKAIVLVSHDRTFIDNIVSVVYEFSFKRLTCYYGNYTSYVQQKNIAMQRQEAAYRHQQQEIQQLEEVIEKFRYKKNKAAFAQSKMTYLKKMERIEKPHPDNKKLKMRFETDIKGGSMVLQTDKLAIGYDKKLCTVSMEVRSGQRLAVIGPNGLGKSTFVKTIVGQVAPLSGDYLFGHQIVAAYFDQTLAQIESDKTVLEELWDEYPEYDHTAIRKILGQFLFTADEVYKTCNVLSGGEKVRLVLAKIMLSKANLLILDEPTNHLDIQGKEALEDALLEYSGTVIFVSHDRYFISKLATCVLYINGDQTKYYPLTYSEYLEKAQSVVANNVAQEKKENVSESQKRRLNEKKIASLERQIDNAEKQLAQLEEMYNLEEYATDYQKLQELSQKQQELRDKIDDLMSQWESYNE